MKYLFLLLIFFTLNAGASNCLIVDKSYTQLVSGFIPQGFIENCPKDLDGKDVTNFLDISYVDNLPIYDAAKRTARLAEIQAKEDEQKAKDDKKKSDWTTFCLTAKVGIEQLVCEDKGYL